MGPVVTIRCTVEMHLELFENGGLASLPQVDDHRWMTTNLGQGSPYLPHPTRYLLTTRVCGLTCFRGSLDSGCTASTLELAGASGP